MLICFNAELSIIDFIRELFLGAVLWSYMVGRLSKCGM